VGRVVEVEAVYPLVEPLVLGTLRQPPQVKETMALQVLQVV
jgi:hypothetical protein